MTILTVMRNRFYNNDGTVAAGGKVYTYAAGTTMPVATYTDNTGNVQNTNPIILDSKGEADIWSSSLIKVNVLQSDNTQITGWPVDYIGSAPSIGILSYRGKWNATTNTPALASGAGTRGYTYIVEVAGTTSIDGIASWDVEDYIAFNGTAWEKIPSGASQATSASVSAAAALASQIAAAASESAAGISETNSAASAAAAAASAAGVNLPAITIANAANMLRVNAGGTGYETQTPAQVLSNIGGAASGANADIISMTALTAPTVASNPIRAIDLQNQTVIAFTTAGTSTAYTLTPVPAISAYTTNQRFAITLHTAPGASPTINISGLGVKNLKYRDSTGAKQFITSTVAPSGWISDCVYDGTDVVMLQVSSKALIQLVTAAVGTGSTGTTVIPFDNTIPQNTEGDQYMSLSITPTNAASTLEIDVQIFLGTAVVSGVVIAALFQDTTANALAAGSFFPNSPGAVMGVIVLKYIMTAGTTSATTFKVRGGQNNAGTTTFNGTAGNQYFGGVCASRITIKEILP